MIYHPFNAIGVVHLSLHALRFLLAVILARELAHVFQLSQVRKQVSKLGFKDPCLVVQCFLFGCFFLGLAYVGDPTTVVRTGFGQPYGINCTTIMEQSFWGAYTRRKFVCEEGVDILRDNYDFHCVSEEERHSYQHAQDWYTVCGTPKEEYWFEIVSLYTFVYVGLLVISQCMTSRPFPQHLSSRSKVD